MDITRMRKPRCYLLYAIAPEDMSASKANQLINHICGDSSLPLTIYHDHFIGNPGGLIMFYAETQEEREALQVGVESYLAEWTYTVHPLIFSHSPAAFDEQIAFTLSVYRDSDWDTLRHEKRPAYGNPCEEAETAQES